MTQRRFSLVNLTLTLLTLAALLTLTACSDDENTATGSGGGGNPNPNSVSIPGLSFSPSNITITVGQKVTWTNNDNISHTVTSTNSAFTSSGNLSPGASYEFTFNTAGSYPYHCSIHPAMTGTVTVNP